MNSKYTPQTPRFFWVTFIYLFFVGIFSIVNSGTAWPAVTVEQRKKVKELSEKTLVAGELYAAGKFSECADSVTEIQIELLTLLESKDRDLLKIAKPLYSRLDRAHGLLELEGAELPVLPRWADIIKAEPMKKDAPDSDAVSFKRDIAPWFISACGNCHVTARRGQFSMVNFDALMQGVRGAKVVYAGDSKGSRLVEIIESGDMPKGSAKVSKEQLDALKKWIDQGAKFDGPNPTASLASFASSANSSTATPSMTPTRMADGSESVSFAKDIAPILAENCKGCHIGGRRASGNLRMDTFAQMMRGGSGGELIAGTNANNSLLIKKLKGQEGQRMPAGRPPLPEEKISLISTWIKEGAKFDGPAPNTNINTVMSQAWASGASHEDLFAKRKETSLASWATVLPNDKPLTASSDEVFVLGNVTQPRIDATLAQIEEAVKQVKKQMKSPAREPLVRGGLSVFVLKSRYDYSEFGRMTETRELPREWLGHWQADPVHVYVALAAENELEEDQANALALQVVTGAYVGAFSGVPEWFAEGIARNVVLTTVRRGDDRVKQWEANLPGALAKVENSGMLLNNRLDEESAGLVGTAITSKMLERANRRRFDKLLELLRGGRDFKEAFTYAFGPPDKFVQAWLGKK